jgi:hypothetical protein
MLKTFRSVAGKREDAKEITITIVYDDIRAGQRAGRLFSLVGLEEGDALKITLQPWRIDLLTDPKWGQFAAAEAIQSDMLVIAMSDLANLPISIEQWFTAWLDGKRGFHAAVVALIEGKDHASHGNSIGIQFLEHATKEAGLDFFMQRTDRFDQALQIIPVPPPQAFSYDKPYRHWGINE